MTKRPIALVSAPILGTISDIHTGEVVMEHNRTRLVRAFSTSVERCVSYGAPSTRFKLSANKDGRILCAIGPIVIRDVAMCFPGCTTSDEIEAADEALDAAGATRGNSPAGRALDWTLRNNSEVSQWRAKRRKMAIFAASLFGGIQLGGSKKPPRAPNRYCIDIVSSYPYMATLPLPRVRDFSIERGLRPHAVLLQIWGTQSDSALFQRTAKGDTCYREEFLGWFSAEEIDYHVQMGRVKVGHVEASMTSPHAEKYLAPSVDHFFTHREKYLRGTPERSVIKSALNGLLGKFASPISAWRSPQPLELEYAKRSRLMSSIELGASSLVKDNTLAGIYPRHSNIIWTALTYARARVRLWQKMDEITALGGRVLWAHTDSVIADYPLGSVPASGTALGDWRIIE